MENSRASATGLELGLIDGPALGPPTSEAQTGGQPTTLGYLDELAAQAAVPVSDTMSGPRPAPDSHLKTALERPLTAVDALTESLRLSPPRSILGQRPTNSAPVRRKKTLPPDLTPRRSESLWQKEAGKNMGPYHRAQNVLARKLGFASDNEEVSQQAMDQYLQLFTKTAYSHVWALSRRAVCHLVVLF